MPTIVAICPYCRAGGVRAPDTAVGASATCPKCKSSFTVLPSDETPARATGAATNHAPPVAETQPAAALPDVTEPSPVLPSDAKPAPKVGGEAPESTDWGYVLALAALILVGPATLASQLPFGRVIGLVVAGVGLVGGLLALGAEGRARLAAAAAAVLHLGAIVVLLFLPTWLGLSPWRPARPQAEPNPWDLAPVAVGHGTNTTGPADLINAEHASWRFRDARVTVRSAALGPVELVGPNGAKRTTREPYLRVVVRVANEGTERPIDPAGTGAGARLFRANGEELRLKTFEAGWEPAGAGGSAALPGRSSDFALVFAPSPSAEALRLELSGAPVGGPEPIRFTLSATFVQDRRKPGPGK